MVSRALSRFTLYAACFLLLWASTLVQAAVIRGQIQKNEKLADFLGLGPQARAVLRRIPSSYSSDLQDETPASPNAREKYTTHIKALGTFVFPDVAPGAYVLEFQTRWHGFPTYRVDVTEEKASQEGSVPDFRSSGPVKIRLHVPGTPLSASLSNPPLPSPFMVQATVKHDFFTEPEGFNVKALLANPMMLIVFLGAGMVFIMPKILANMDPEALAEIEASQARMQKQMTAFQSGDIGSILKGDSAPAAAAGSSSAVKSGGGARRR